MPPFPSVRKKSSGDRDRKRRALRALHQSAKGHGLAGSEGLEQGPGRSFKGAAQGKGEIALIQLPRANSVMQRFKGFPVVLQGPGRNQRPERNRGVLDLFAQNPWRGAVEGPEGEERQGGIGDQPLG